MDEERRSNRSTKPKSRVLMIAVIILAALAVAAAVIFVLPTLQGAKDEVMPLPFTTNDNYAVYGSGIVYLQGDTLHAIDAAGKELWSLPGQDPELRLAASDGLVAGFTRSYIQVFDQKGAPVFKREFLGSILDVRCSKTQIALIRLDQGKSNLILLDAAGKELMAVALNNQSMLDFGFDQAQNILWTISLDTSGSTPVTRIATYSADAANIGMITLDSQTVQGVAFAKSLVFVVGTNHVMSYEYAGKKRAERLIYGWEKESLKFDDGGLFQVLLTPVGDTSGHLSRAMGRFLEFNKSGQPSNETMIYLPEECKRALLTPKCIVAVSEGALDVYDNQGKHQRRVEVDGALDDAMVVFGANTLLIRNGEQLSLINLPV